MSTEDAPLVEKSLNGDREAFAELVRKYQRRIIALSHHIIGDFQMGEDAAQETFLRAFKSLKTLKDPAKFRSWLSGIAYKVCINWLRQENVKKKVMESQQNIRFASGIPPSLKGVSDGRLSSGLAGKVVAAVNALPVESKSLLALKYLQGMSYAEIAELMQVTEEKVKSRLHVARTRLREKMGTLREE
jgi:RNA polymerase sigma-70 factor (ECF subfamily)